MPDVSALLDAVVEWARSREDIVAVALVGSHARGTPNPESDVDLILLVEHPEQSTAQREWVHEFGRQVQAPAAAVRARR